jgi:hypothetical protein
MRRGAGFPRIGSRPVDVGAYELQEIQTEPPSEVPEDKRSCKKGGSKEFGLINQGR